MLISGDRDFANALHRLRQRGYHIILALPNRLVATALSLAADHVWYAVSTNFRRQEFTNSRKSITLFKYMHT